MTYTLVSKRHPSFVFPFFTLTLAVEIFLLQFSYSSFSLSLFLLTTAVSLIFISKSRPLIPLLYVVSTIIAVLVYEYWLSFSEKGSGYYLGRFSDDWQYDVLWSEGYAEKYSLNPFHIVEHLNSITPGLGYFHNSKGYVYLITVLQFFSNLIDSYHTLIARFLNLYLLSLTAIIGLRSLEKFYKIRVSARHVLILIFYPTLVLTSSHVFRDTAVMFLMVVFFSYLLRFKINEISFTRFAVSVMFVLLALLTLRVSVAPILVLAAIASFFRFNAKSIWVISIIFAAVASLVVYLYGDMLLRLFSSYSELNKQRFDGFARNIFSLPIYIGFIPRLFYSFYIPTPNLSHVYQLISSLAAFIQVFSAPGILRSLLSKKIPVELKMFFLVTWFSVVVSTMTFRHALMYIPFGIMLWIVGFHREIFSINYRYFFELVLFISLSMFVFLSVSVIT